MSQSPAPLTPSAPAPAFDAGMPAPPPPPPPGAAAPPAPAAPAAAPAPPAPPAPFAPAMPLAEAIAAAPPAPAQFTMPTDAASALDLGAPLMHAPAPLKAASAVVEPEVARPAARPLDPTSAPVAIGGVTAATAADLADRDRAERAAEASPTATPTWWAPANALVIAVAALTWQFISFYGREQLPSVKVSGAELRGFDSLVDMLPLATASAGRFVGIALAALALSIVLYGTRRGVREPVMQGIVAGVAGLSLVMLASLPALVG